jgi:hypothetical protein
MKIRTRSGEVVGEVATNHGMNIYEACELAGVDTDDYAFDELVMDYDDEDAYKPAVIASIKLDDLEGRGSIFAELEDTDYYGETTQAYIVRVMLPDGSVVNPSLAPRRTMEEVNDAIEATWGSECDLQWGA